MRRSFVGDDTERFPTDDDAYRELALWGDLNARRLNLKIRIRRLWLYASMVGIAVEFAGLVVLHVDRLFV